jgi:hypothetical protein
MTKPHSTATAAQVSPSATGRVSATEADGVWVIDATSLYAHLADRIASQADYTPDKNKAQARENVTNLIETGGIIAQARIGIYLAVSKDPKKAGVTYLIDTVEGTCNCPSGLRNGYCSHRTTADAIETVEATKGNTPPGLHPHRRLNHPPPH